MVFGHDPREISSYAFRDLELMDLVAAELFGSPEVDAEDAE